MTGFDRTDLTDRNHVPGGGTLAMTGFDRTDRNHVPGGGTT